MKNDLEYRKRRLQIVGILLSALMLLTGLALYLIAG